MKDKPVHVLGAGPAGLCSAIILARQGHTVHIHERYEAAGKRFQGDLQGLENWTSAENVLSQFQNYGITINFEATPYHDVTITDGKTSFQRSANEPLFYLVKRGMMEGSLDQGLQQQAEELGIQFHYRSSISKDDADIIATGPIRQAVVAADKGVVFPSHLPNMAVALFHDDFAFLGYSYLLICNGYGCLCTVVFRDMHRLNECFERTVEVAKALYAIDLDNAHPVGGIGSFCLNHPKQNGKGRLIGEAAGFQDMLWGFGIRTAITSGYLAAQSLLQHQSYPDLVEEQITPYLKASMVNRYLWERFKLNSKPILPWMMALPFSLRTDFRLLYQYSFFHQMLYPLAERYIQKQYPNSIELK